MYSNNLVPTITKPTRVTPGTATLIDNIFTNNFTESQSHHQGLIYNDLTDHFPIFHINFNIKLDPIPEKFIWKRQINPQSISNFVQACNNIDWTDITSNNCAQEAFRLFHSKLHTLYNKSFPLRKIKITNYKSRQPWLNPGLKKSI